jgi:hypothetical protein
MDRRSLLVSLVLLPIGLVGGSIARVVNQVADGEFRPFRHPIDYEWRDGTLWVHWWNDVKGWRAERLSPP